MGSLSGDLAGQAIGTGLELRHLRYFVAVAEQQHFGRAAKALHTAQPSLSNQIRQLEDDIGTPLFVRTTRKVSLTPAGETFLEESRRVLEQLESGIRRTREVACGKRGSLRLAYISGAMQNVLPRMLRDFSEAYPDVAVYLQSMWTDDQIEGLRERRLDVGIFATDLNPDGLTHDEGWRSPLVLATPVGHPLGTKTSLRYEDLEGQQVVVSRASGSRMGDSIAGVLRRYNVNVSYVFEGAEVDTIIGLVAARRGIALVPSSWSTISQYGVEFRPIAPTTYLPGLGLYWNPEAADPLVRTFLDSARRTIASFSPAIVAQGAISST